MKVTIKKVPGGYDLFAGRELAGQAFTKAEALRKATQIRRGRYVSIPVSRRRNPGGKRMTKAQKRVKAQKASVQRRVAVALAKFLKQANPGMKTAGATVTKLKGGAMRITPIRANAAKRGSVTIRKGYGGYYVAVDGQPVGGARAGAWSKKEATQIARLIRAGK